MGSEREWIGEGDFTARRRRETGESEAGRGRLSERIVGFEGKE